MSQRLTMTVRGRVQGVGFRWHTQRQAGTLGLTGMVANRADGSVLIVAEGGRAQLEALAAWARVGPPRALVDACEVSWGEARGGLPDFTIEG